MKEKIKVFISHKFRDLPEELILKNRRAIVNLVTAEYKNVEIIESYHPEFDKNSVKQLGESIKEMSDADLIVFSKVSTDNVANFRYDQDCKYAEYIGGSEIEFLIASRYNKRYRLYEFTNEIEGSLKVNWASDEYNPGVKLNRYVLLENNEIIEITNEKWDYINTFNIVNNKLLTGETDPNGVFYPYSSHQFGDLQIIETTNNILDLITTGDLIETSEGKIEQVVHPISPEYLAMCSNNYMIPGGDIKVIWKKILNRHSNKINGKQESIYVSYDVPKK